MKPRCNRYCSTGVLAAFVLSLAAFSTHSAKDPDTAPTGLAAAADTATSNVTSKSVTDKEWLARGEYLTAAAGCVTCHTDNENGGIPFAGGHRLETPAGVFVTPNITPDPETGIGGWTDDAFVMAVKHGTAPDGSHYYPAFPYPSYAGMTDADARAIKAYLDSLDPAVRANGAHELRWYVPGRWAIGVWKYMFSPWNYGPAPDEPRGAYLVRHLGHCGECHTPRNIAYALMTEAELQGSPKDAMGRSAPAINGPSLIANGWSQADIEFFLEFGMLPDGDFAGGSMASVIDDNTSRLSPDDRAAIARYLLRVGSTGQ